MLASNPVPNMNHKTPDLGIQIRLSLRSSRSRHQDFRDLTDAFFLAVVFLPAGFFAAGFLAFAEEAGFFAALALGAEAEDCACFIIVLANFVKNCSANDFAVVSIKRDPNMASLPPICASTS